MPNTTALSGTLRIATGLILLAGAVYAGYLARSPWIIPVLGVAYTVSFVVGRWQRWKLAAEAGLLNKALLGIPITFLIQCVLVGVLYLIGFGIGAAAGGHEGFQPFEPKLDVVWSAALGLGAALAGLVIAFLEMRGVDRAPSAHQDVYEVQIEPGASDAPELVIDPKPLTVDTFYLGLHHSHRLPENGEPARNSSAKAHVTAQQIADREAELGVQFPALLRELYLKQNGGYVGWLYVAAKDNPGPYFDDWRGAFSIDYSDLAPLEHVRTLWEAYEDFADLSNPEEVEAYQVPVNAKQIILLSQRYMDCTVLDYSQPGPPRAGLVDFDGGPEPDVWFDTFEDLFAALRREEEED